MLIMEVILPQGSKRRLGPFSRAERCEDLLVVGLDQVTRRCFTARAAASARLAAPSLERMVLTWNLAV